MRTIGKRYAGPSRNWQETCDYCGIMWNRSEMVLNDEGFIACPDDMRGRTARTLDYQRAGDVSEPSTVRGKTREY